MLGYRTPYTKHFCFPEPPGEFCDQFVKVKGLVVNLEGMSGWAGYPGEDPALRSSQCGLDRSCPCLVQPTDAFCLGCTVPPFKS